MSAARTSRTAPVAALASSVWLLNQLRWARATRPEPLPDPPAGSTEVLTADGIRLHAQVGGRTDSDLTMVFVHGFLARTMSFDMQWNHFPDKARLVRYDHRNHGRSDHTSKVLTIETLADDLAAVIEQLAPTGRVLLVGHSMGGMTSLVLAARSPQLFARRVAGLALVATGAGHTIDGHRWENAFRWGARRRLLAPSLLVLRLLAPGLERLRPRRTHLLRSATRIVMFGTQDVDPALLSMTHTMIEEPPLSTMTSLQGSLLRHDALRALATLRATPVLVLTGAEDRLTRPEHSRRMAADIGPSAELVIVPGAGHIVNQSRPVETNAALDALLVRAFAREHSSMSAAG